MQMMHIPYRVGESGPSVECVGGHHPETGIEAPRMAGSKKRERTRAPKSANTARPFERVWSIVQRVPRGRVVTYGQLARMIEHRLSPVGIGWAVRAAPEGSIPWHRVVNSQGGISTDREHPGLQRAMLEAEGIVFDADGHIDLARIGWRRAR
jgi:methylated-DNA-protein-cysteine methyltransferase related protein